MAFNFLSLETPPEISKHLLAYILKKNCCYLSCFFWLSHLEVWHNDQNCKANMGRNGKIIFVGVIKNTSKDLKFQINVKKMKAISLMEANDERISAVITFYVCLPDRINLDTFLKSNCMFFSVKMLSKIIFIFYVCDRRGFLSYHNDYQKQGQYVSYRRSVSKASPVLRKGLLAKAFNTILNVVCRKSISCRQSQEEAREETNSSI